MTARRRKRGGIMVFYEKSEHVIHVKFIRYTGRYPNLCSGELTIEVDGKGREKIWDAVLAR